MSTARGTLTRSLWWLLWTCALAVLATQSVDAMQRAAPAPVWLIKLAPLAVLLPGLWADRPRAGIWICFVSLLYFLFAVLRVFAEPQSPRAVIELVAIVGLFISAMFYARQRSQEIAYARQRSQEIADARQRAEEIADARQRAQERRPVTPEDPA